MSLFFVYFSLFNFSVTHKVLLCSSLLCTAFWTLQNLDYCYAGSVGGIICSLSNNVLLFYLMVL